MYNSFLPLSAARGHYFSFSALLFLCFLWLSHRLFSWSYISSLLILCWIISKYSFNSNIPLKCPCLGHKIQLSIISINQSWVVLANSTVSFILLAFILKHNVLIVFFTSFSISFAKLKFTSRPWHFRGSQRSMSATFYATFTFMLTLTSSTTPNTIYIVTSLLVIHVKA